MKYPKLFYFIASAALLFSCTKLEENFQGDLTSDQVGSGGAGNATALLKGVYDAMRTPYQDQSRVWAAQEHTSDDAIGPTRGGDWDDNGVWRVLHVHKWDGDHLFLRQTFEDLGGVILLPQTCCDTAHLLSRRQKQDSLRAFAMFSMLDGWDQVPYREPGGTILELPKVRTGTEALTYIISELNAIMNDLPNGPANIANKDAARLY